MTTAGLRLGAPGVYEAPELPDRSLRPVRLDVAGFVGVAPRGPVDQPTLVRSWSDYRLRFGAFEGAGRLPYAVSVFFDQGGERAYVVRVGRPGPRRDGEHDDDVAMLELVLPGREHPVRFVAANPGTWGNALTLHLDFDATPQFRVRTLPTSSDGTPVTPDILVPQGISVPVGSLLLLRGPAMAPQGEFRWVDAVVMRDVEQTRRVPVAVLDGVVAVLPGDGAGLVASVVTGTLAVSDGDRDGSRTERFTGLGLDPVHPRPLASVVRRESLLVRPVGEWTRRRLLPPNPLLSSVLSNPPLRRGNDIEEYVDGSSFFDDRTELDLDDELDVDLQIAAAAEDAAQRLRGATGLARVAEIGMLAVPDLFWAWQEERPPPEEAAVPGTATFQDCPPAPLRVEYSGRQEAVLLDARTQADLAEIVRRQSLLVGLAEQYRRFVALLDVPQHLDARGIARWRASFDSGFAAAYHPWLGVLQGRRAVGGGIPRRVWVPPSAFAAGIIAARERRFGLPWGPAGELAAGAVVAAAAVSPAEHDVLHPIGINVFRAERDGFRLTTARTLAGDPSVRQLSVRRLLTMLALALHRQTQWVVFEPNTPALRELLRHTLLAFLREMYRAGAFAGDTEDQAFFVRVGDDVNPPASLDLGRLVAEVGVAPAEPVEFIVLRIIRDGDGGVRVEERTSDG